MIKKHIPNLLTCCNLICGCLGIIFLYQGHADWVPYFVWAAAGFDFLDGFAARMLGVSSPIGGELDSLADMVTFGVLPALLVVQLLSGIDPHWLIYGGLTIAVFSALRLAKFNVDTRQTDGFLGLATPANALFFTSIPLLSQDLFGWLKQPYILLAFAVAFSLLMVSEIPFFALKFKAFNWKDNKIRIIAVLISAILLILLQINAIPIIILGYILTSITLHLRKTLT